MLDISKKTMYRLLKSGRLPHIRVGRLIRINVQDIRALAVQYNGDGRYAQYTHQPEKEIPGLHEAHKAPKEAGDE